MENPKPDLSFVRVLGKVISVVERIAFAIAFAGVIFKYMQWPMANELLIMGLFTIAITLFLSGFQMVSTSQRLIAVIFKLGYIGSAVAVIGILFTILHFEGGTQMITVAMPTLAGVVVFAGVFSAKYDDTLRVLRPMLMRAGPLLLCCIYLFLKLQK